MTTPKPNTTATGGYLQPAPKLPDLISIPPNLSFLDFMQSVIVGVSGFQGSLIRPQWQPNPPKRPAIGVNWIALGIEGVEPNFNAYQGYNSEGEPFLQQNELFGLVVSFYGPNAYESYGLVRDNLQIEQNLTALRAAKVGYAYDIPGRHVPDLIDEEWFDRWVATFYFRRQILRTYPLLTFTSANGTIEANTPGTETIQVPISVRGGS